MSTKKVSTNTTQFDPTSMRQYQNFWGTASPLINSMVSNPFSSPFYNLNLRQNVGAAQQVGSNAIQNVLQNFNQSGFGGTNSPLGSSLLTSLNRFQSGQTAQGFYSAANNAQSNMWNSLGLGASRQPLVTGGTQTQTTSGLGTWLPQVAGMGLSALTMGLGGGFGGGGGGTSGLPLVGASGVGSGSPAAYTQLQNYPNAPTGFNTLPFSPGGGGYFNPLMGGLH